ncbi:MAG: amidohydrolase family protein, partial [Alphaproteobacteria bacterium]
MLLSFTFPIAESYDFVIENVKLFDGNKVIEHANIYIKDGLISRIDSVKTSLNCKYNYRINGHNKTLIPGLINAHVHIQSRENLNNSAQAGILTVMELLRLEEDSIPIYKTLSDSAGFPYFFTSGIGADMPDAVFKRFIQKINPYAPTTIKGVELFLSDRVNKKVDFIKVYQDSRLPQKFSDTLFDKLISETHKNNLLAIVHSETLRDACYEFDHGADIIAHGWIDSLITDDELSKWKERPFYVIPTLQVHLSVKKQLNPKSYTLTAEQISGEIGRLHKAGITLLAGSDSPADNLNFTTDFYKELALFVRAGLSPLEALKTATVNPAKAYKLKGKGEIKVGTSADFVLVKGDI